MKNLIMIILLFLAADHLCAKNSSDTTYEWKLKFGKYAVPQLSSNGRWLAVKKFYRQKPDTVFLYDIQNRKSNFGYILCTGLTEFLDNQGVIGIHANTAELLNLNTAEKKAFPNVRNLYVLNDILTFALLSKDNNLTLYNTNGEEIRTVHNIDGQIITDHRKKLFLSRKVADQWEVIEVLKDKEIIIYSTSSPIKKILLPGSGEKLFIAEESPTKEKDRLTVISANNQKSILLSLDIPENSEISIDNLQDDHNYLIGTKVRTPYNNKESVDIWYGNNPFLNAPEKLFNSRYVWLWNSKNSKVTLINDSKNTQIISLNNKRFFLSYIPGKDHNYLTSSPELNDAQLFDIEKGTYRTLGNLKRINQMKKGARMKTLGEEVIYSPDGKWFLASVNGMNWSLYYINGEKKALINNTELELPVFSSKNDKIYFESSNGLWEYNIKLSKLTHKNVGSRKIVKIKNKSTLKNGPTLLSYLKTEEILLEEYEKQTAETSYSIFKKNKWNTIIPSTTNSISEVLYYDNMQSFVTLEENFNSPPSIFKYELRRPSELILDGNTMDRSAEKIKQEILNYRAVDLSMNGILYYPKNFDASKKYPMVVHIYEVQRYESNEYLSPNNQMPVGFQIRDLLERGYFVYLPDIVFSNKGTGISALECVENAMDIVLKNNNIDSTKIALVGHSHGGYETNFIATHSQRFKTYISGAGTSDVIRSYYSYNYNFGKPFYFQYETGQYQMGTSVAYDKNRYLANSPILYVENVNAPILLWSGRLDENIATDQVTEFFIGLQRYKKDVIALFYPKGEHSFLSGSFEEKDLNFRILDWLEYFLKGKRGFKWIEDQIKKDA